MEIAGHKLCKECGEPVPLIPGRYRVPDPVIICRPCAHRLAEERDKASIRYEVEGRVFERKPPKYKPRKRTQGGKKDAANASLARMRALGRLQAMFPHSYRVLYMQERENLGLRPYTVNRGPAVDAAITAELDEAENQAL